MNTKEVKKRVGKKSFYLSIINSVKDYHKLPELGISKQSLNYYVRKLVLDDIIHKKGYGTWELNQDKYEQWKFIKQVKKKGTMGLVESGKVFTSLKDIRGHGFMFTLRLPYIKNWDKRRDFLDKEGIKWTPTGNNWKGESLKGYPCTIHLTPKSIILWSHKKKSFWGDTAQESFENALEYAASLFKTIEKDLKSCFSIGGKYNIKTCKHHYGHVDNALAKRVIGADQRVVLYDMQGEWLRIDFSQGKFVELETTGSNSDVDMDEVIRPFFNKLKSNPNVLDDLDKRIGEVVGIVSDLGKQGLVTSKQLSIAVKGIEALSLIIKGNDSIVAVEDDLDERPRYIG